MDVITCNAATCTKPPREAMLCVTVGAAQLRRVVCIECRVALDRQGREVNVHHGASVTSWCEARPVPTLTERPAPPECQEPEALVPQHGTPPAPSHPSPQVATMPEPRCLFPGCTKSVKARGICTGHYNQAHRLGALSSTSVDLSKLRELIDRGREPAAPVVVPGQPASATGLGEVARLTAALEASNARNLVTIESVGRLERERDEAQADLAAIDDAIGLPGSRETSNADRLGRIEGIRTFHDDELEAIDGALGYDEHDTRHDGDRVDRIEVLHEQLLVAEQDRDRLGVKLAAVTAQRGDARAESAHLALDLGPGLLDTRSTRAIVIALDALDEVTTDLAASALIGVVRALVCG